MFAQHGAQGYMFTISSLPKQKYTALKTNNKLDNVSTAQKDQKIAIKKQGIATTLSKKTENKIKMQACFHNTGLRVYVY